MNRRCFIQMSYYLLVCLFLMISAASARVCFLPDSTDCGSSDVDIPDIPCKYYTCKEAGLKNEAYQTCYDERTFNKGGTLVPCKQVKCKLSKSECEEQAKATSHSCQIDKISGCHYLGECKQCNKDVYDLKEPKSGSDWECDSCTGCDGTVYSCRYKQSCEGLNYSTSCSDSQIAHEVEGVKDSEGNQCYTCESKPAGCTYEYRQATTEDSCGLRDFENTTKCMDSINGCQCYTQLIKVSSLSAGAGTVTPINKISNKSATCVDENNVTKYEKICEGTARSYCDTSNGYEFTPNGCVSDTYNNGFEVKGDEFGSCIKKEEKCDYKYAHLTRDEISGVNSDNTTFGINSGLYSNIQSHRGNTEGIYAYSVGEYTNKAANRIDKTSKTCTRPDGTTVYEKVCEGTIKAACKEKFESNGCFSSSYQVTLYYDGRFHGLNVEAAEFGTCGCDSDKGLFGTEQACKDASQLNCYAVKKCYQTCEAGGMYSTKEKCEEGLPGDSQCVAFSTCYARRKFGWGLHYGDNLTEAKTRTYSCSLKRTENGQNNGASSSASITWTAMVSGKNEVNATKDVNGNVHNSLSDDARYLAGEYRVCVNYGFDRYIAPTSLHLAKRTGEYCHYTYNSAAGRWYVDHNDFCTGLPYDPHSSSCITGTFEDGVEYYISAGMVTNDSRYTCSSQRY